MSTLTQQLAELLDREAIRDLPLRYCDYVWRDDADGVSSLFTTEAKFVVVTPTGETAIEGRENLRTFYADSFSDQPRPFIHNHVIEMLDDKQARGRCYLDLRSGKHDMDWLGSGYYADEYVKRDGEWLFAARRFTVLRMDEWPGSVDF